MRVRGFEPHTWQIVLVFRESYLRIIFSLARAQWFMIIFLYHDKGPPRQCPSINFLKIIVGSCCISLYSLTNILKSMTNRRQTIHKRNLFLNWLQRIVICFHCKPRFVTSLAFKLSFPADPVPSIPWCGYIRSTTLKGQKRTNKCYVPVQSYCKLQLNK